MAYRGMRCRRTASGHSSTALTTHSKRTQIQGRGASIRPMVEACGSTAHVLEVYLSVLICHRQSTDAYLAVVVPGADAVQGGVGVQQRGAAGE